jgi:hypothetical protein
MNPERRQSLRQVPQSLIYLDLEPSNGGIVLDLNEQGMKISVANPLANANAGEIRFSLSLQPKQRARGTCRIAWISASGRSAGVRFASLPQESLVQIRECLAVQAQTEKALATERVEGEPAEVAEAATTQAEAPFAAASLSPNDACAAEGAALPSILSLNDRGRRDEFSARPLAPEPAEESATEAVQMSEADSPCPAGVAPVCDAAPDSTEEKQAEKEAATPMKKDAQAGEPATPAPPPPWLEALIEAGRRRRDEDMLLQTEPMQEAAEPVQAGIGETGPEDASTQEVTDQEPEPLTPAESPKALYLPNYQIKPDRPAEAVQLSKSQGRDNLETAMNLALERFEEFGWTLESDWHIWIALVLVGAGFLALAQDPPLPLVAAALWVASAAVAVKRKQRPRPAGQADSGRQ